jgi:hypothetical protein
MGDIVDVIQLELGDIISTNNQTFFISYIDLNSHTTWVNIDSFEKLTFELTAGQFAVTDIVGEITLLSRSTEKGFAAQNKLLLGTWIDIEFGSGMIITGLITGLEEDMIKIQNFIPGSEMFYIDFAYKGIPEELQIKNICIRGKPLSLQEPDVEEDKEPEIEEDGQNDTEEGPVFNQDGSLDIILPENTEVEETYRERLLDLARKEQYSQDSNDSDQHVAYVSKKLQKYQIGAQLNDLYNELLALIPDEKRTHNRLRAAETHIRRFEELRDGFSLKDGIHIIGRRPKRDPILHKPMCDSLMNQDVRVPWVTPVVTQKQKLYDLYKNEKNREIPYDVVSIELGSELKAENQSRDALFYKNANGQTGYVNYEKMESTGMKFLTPFEEFNSFVSFELAPKMDIDAIVANFYESDNYFNGTFSAPGKRNTNEPRSSAFAMQRYNEAIYYYPEIRKKVTEKAVLMPEDVMDVQSFLFLPTQYVLYGKQFLQGATIYEKSNNLYDRHLYKCNTLQNKDIVPFEGNIEIINRKDKKQRRLYPRDKKIQHFILQDKNLTQENEDAFTNEDKLYKKAQLTAKLNAQLPNIFEVIEWFEPQNKKTYSVQNFAKVLEPFLFYYGDLTDASLKKLRYFLMENQRLYFERQIKQTKLYQQMQKEKFIVNYNPEQNLTNETLNNLLMEPQLQIKMESSYKLEKYNSSSFLHEIYKLDDGELFTHLIKHAGSEQLSNKEDFLQEENNDVVQEESAYNNEVDCNKRVLTKIYHSLEELKADKNKDELLYDTELDFTNYKLIDKYKTERKEMKKDDFLQFLQTQLVEKHNCPRRIAKETAETMIRGTKLVQEGEYAKLITYPKLPSTVEEEQLSETVKKELEIEKNVRKQETFYIRNKNTWVHDSSVDNLAFTDTTVLFCNLNDKCYRKDSGSECENIELETKERMLRQAKTDMKQELLSRFDRHVGESKEKMEAKLIDMHERMVKIKQITALRVLSANNYSHNLGKGMLKTEKMVSPYWKKRDNLFHRSINFSRKQALIIEFYKNYCREPVSTENAGWKYCVESNAILLESSLYTLAEAFQNGIYLKTLDMLCKKQGILSDDGDKVMDRESGCELKKLEFSEEGAFLFALDDETNTNDQINNTSETIEVRKLKQIKMKNNESNYKEDNMQDVYNNLKAFCESTYVPLDEIEFEVMTTCRRLFAVQNVITKEKIYNVNREAMIKKVASTQKVATWEEYVKSRKMEILAAVILTVVQQKIPSFHTTKYERSCTYSFEGYPLEPDNMKGIEYISCVFTLLWKSQKTLIGKNFAANIKTFLEKYIVGDEELKKKFQAKRDYLAANPTLTTPIPNDVTIWSRFSPPLVEISVLSGHVTFVPPEFHTNLLNYIKDGDRKQWESSSTYGVKLQIFVYGFVELIQNLLQKKETLLNTISQVPFHQNACCNDNSNLTPIQYFGSDSKVGLYLKTMFTISRLIDDFRKNYKTSFLHVVPAKNAVESKDIPTLYQNVDDSVMFKTMMFYCRYDYDNQVLPNDLSDIFKSKPPTYDPFASFLEKVENLKENGIVLNQKIFSQMMVKIQQRHLMKPGINLDVTWNSQSTAALNTLSDNLGNVFKDTGIMQAFLKVVDQEIPSNETKSSLNNVLQKLNTQWKSEITQFMKGKYHKKKTIVSDFFSTVIEDNKDMSLDRLNYYVMSYVKHISCLFPLYIGTEQLHKAKLSLTQWKLTNEDEIEYGRFHSFHYKDLNSLKGESFNAVLSPVLMRVQSELQPALYLFHSIIQLFPHHLPENKLLIQRCYTFIILLVFKTFMVYSEDKDVISETKKSQHKKENPKEHLDIVIELESETDVGMIESQMTLQGALADLFLFYFQYDIQKVNFMSYADIIKIIDKGKEIEKQAVKKYFAGLQRTSTDLFKAEVSMKRLNLGRYFMNQKNLITYGKKVDNFYDDKDENEVDMLNEFNVEGDDDEELIVGEINEGDEYDDDGEGEDDDEFVPPGEDDDTNDIFDHGYDN